MSTVIKELIILNKYRCWYDVILIAKQNLQKLF